MQSEISSHRKMNSTETIKQPAAPSDIVLEANPEFFSKFLKDQPLVELSQTMSSFSFNHVKTLTEKSGRESFLDSDILESQNYNNNKSFATNIRLLEEINKNQKLEQQVRELEELLQRLLSENKQVLALMEKQTKQLALKDSELLRLRQQIVELRAQNSAIKSYAKNYDHALSEASDKKSQPSPYISPLTKQLNHNHGQSALDLHKRFPMKDYQHNMRVVNDIHLNCQFRFTANTPKQDSLVNRSHVHQKEQDVSIDPHMSQVNNLRCIQVRAPPPPSTQYEKMQFIHRKNLRSIKGEWYSTDRSTKNSGIA